MNFDYQSEKLSQARSCLMLPHSDGEEASVAEAFMLCGRAFYRFDTSLIKDENAIIWIETIKRFMDTAGVSDPTGEGTAIQRARQLTNDDKAEFSRAVDELANWFDRPD
jgi:hypothetical protein